MLPEKISQMANTTMNSNNNGNEKFVCNNVVFDRNLYYG